VLTSLEGWEGKLGSVCTDTMRIDKRDKKRRCFGEYLILENYINYYNNLIDLPLS
jgi:hypothetical protein